MEDTAAATQTSQADLFNVITYYVKSWTQSNTVKKNP